MEVVYRGRRLGKSTEMVKLALAHDAYIVVPDRHQAHFLREQYPNIKMPITWQELMQSNLQGMHPSARKVVIDNLDECLQSMVRPVKIMGVSLNNDSEIWTPDLD